VVQLFDVVTPGVIISQLPQVSAYASAIGVSRLDVNSALISAAHSRCIAVHPYVVDDRGEMQSLLQSGVDGIFTDRPDLMRDVVNGTSVGGDAISGCPVAVQ
jgi:glycerophosphoryl diester phosphodiesterase